MADPKPPESTEQVAQMLLDAAKPYFNGTNSWLGLTIYAATFAVFCPLCAAAIATFLSFGSLSIRYWRFWPKVTRKMPPLGFSVFGLGPNRDSDEYEANAAQTLVMSVIKESHEKLARHVLGLEERIAMLELPKRPASADANLTQRRRKSKRGRDLRQRSARTGRQSIMKARRP